MDFSYSPRQDAGGTLHLPSPTHHRYRVDGFPSIRQIRRSMAQSPSKPSRFSLYSKSPSRSPETPVSPLALSKTFGARSASDVELNRSLPSSPSHSPATTAKKNKFGLRRSCTTRASTRNRPTKFPIRYALGDSPNSANMGLPAPESPVKPLPTTTTPSGPMLKRSRAMDPPPANLTKNHQMPSTPSASHEQSSSYSIAKPLPAAFMSTGLISKRNRPSDMGGDSLGSFEMPETPSKRASFPPATHKPFPRSGLSRSIRHLDESTSSGTPFSPTPGKASGSGKGMGIFGVPFNRPSIPRRESFASIDGDDWTNNGLQTDSQSSNDELPPTPTKPNGSMRSSHNKENSLRSSLFGRRASLGLETFVPPQQESHSPKRGKTTPVGSFGAERSSPHTPQDTFVPPDPSGLSISGNQARRVSMPVHTSFNTSTNSGIFPPATPTTQREQFFQFGTGKSARTSLIGLRPHDVDTSLSSRFENVSVYGTGEFSKVYRVEKPFNTSQLSFSVSPSSVWAVKKSRRPYTGYKDRENKLKEVEILRRLRRHDNVIQFTDSWEDGSHLYIQTEFCENGNLRDFLTSAGYKARLDDFRIWKILLELAHGVKAIHDSGLIHLDLKPANVFIDWEGVLKIGDFGLASTWPAPRGIEGEGDREYIGPEVLSGQFDKPADIFALGMILLEISGNIVLPDYGASWQRLRSGNFSDVPSLTWSSDSTLARDESGEPIVNSLGVTDALSSPNGDNSFENFKFLQDIPKTIRRPQELVSPPAFMVDARDLESLDKLVQWMIAPDPSQRPMIDQICSSKSVQWVGQRRRAGATIYEGNFGPSDEVLNAGNDIDMLDAA